MGGLTFTDEAARHLEKTYRTKALLRSGATQFGTSTYRPVKKSWISDVAQAFCAKR